MGTVWVDVLFGNKENNRIESLQFEVVDLESPYHALLGRPALAKFMASTHVAYLKMKLPGPNITISGNYKRAMECASAGSNLAESLVIAAEKKRILEVVALPSQLSSAYRVWATRIRAPRFRRKASSSTSSVRIGTSLHGPIRTCRVFRGSCLSTY